MHPHPTTTRVEAPGTPVASYSLAFAASEITVDLKRDLLMVDLGAGLDIRFHLPATPRAREMVIGAVNAARLDHGADLSPVRYRLTLIPFVVGNDIEHRATALLRDH